MLTKAGLPGWFPEGFKADPDLLAAFEAGHRKMAARKQEHSATWDDVAAVVNLASQAGHHIAGTPDTYRHGWIKVGEGAYGNDPQAKRYNGHTLIVKPMQKRTSTPSWSAYVDGKRVDARPDEDGAKQAAHESADKGGLPSASMVHAAQRNPILPGSVAAIRRQTATARSASFTRTWDDVASVVEMAAAAAVPGQQIAAGQPATAAAVSPAKSANATAQPRVAAGSPAGGQFAPPGSGSGGGGKQPMDAHQQHVAHLQHLATHGTPTQQTAAKALLAKMSAGSGKTAASKPTAPKATAKAGTSKASTSKATVSKTTASTSKAAAPKPASTTAKATAHQQHAAHVAHLQHLATHGNPAQKKAAAAVLARMGVKV